MTSMMAAQIMLGKTVLVTGKNALGTELVQIKGKILSVCFGTDNMFHFL